MQASQRAKKIMKIKDITGSLLVKDYRKRTVFPSSEKASYTLGSKPMSVIRAELNQQAEEKEEFVKKSTNIQN